MRYDESKSFPHPVLRLGSEDYVDGAFQATAKGLLSKNGEKVRVEARFLTSEPSILRLLKEKKAEFALLVDARDTYFRSLITTSDTQVSREYGGGQIKGTVTLLPYIVATKDINDYKSKLFNPEYRGQSFEIEAGDVLALDAPREFYVGQEIFAHIGTVFELVEEDGLAMGEIRLELENEKVQVRVSPKQKELLDSARAQSSLRPILVASVYQPTLMQVLAHIAKGSEEFEQKKWYRSISAKCDQMNIDLGPETDLLSVTQRLLNFPVNALNATFFKSE